MANCRTNNYCVFCKFWLGREADVNWQSGESKLPLSDGLCSLKNECKKPKSLCAKFERRLKYR